MIKRSCLPFTGICILLLSAGKLSAQTPVIPPAAYNALVPINYVRTWDALAPEQDENILLARPTRDVKQTTQYLDGLGRPVQAVVKEGSLVTGSTPVDMVSGNLYDAFGREQYKYLPFSANSTGGNTHINDGIFKANPFQQQVAFYNNQLGGQAGEINIGSSNLNWAYGKVNFEASPLNRATDTYAPGSSWVGSEAGTSTQQRNVQVKYVLNTSTDDVKIWVVTDAATAGDFGSYATTAAYPAGELFKTITTDEHKKQVIEFKDKEGKVILKKVQLTATADDGTGSGYTGWLNTYYIYDDENNLRCVVQPKAVEQLPGSWVLTSSTILNELTFRYEYDSRNRMIKKQVPGAAPVSMVYDARDRLVLSQDGNLAAQGKWMYTQYDALNRPVATGLWVSSLTWAQHTTAAAGSSNYPTMSGQEELTRTFYDEYDNWLLANGSPFANTRSTADDSYLNTASTGYPYSQAAVQSSRTIGLITGNKVKILGTTDTYLYTIIFYDDKGRVIQTQAQNITGGTDITTTQYNWAGQPLLAITRQEKAGTNAQTNIVLSRISYDDLGRAIVTEKKISSSLINSGAMPPDFTTTAKMEYDALGQLKKKKLGTKPGTSDELESLNFDYNIRGWLLGANRAYAKDANQANYFGFDLGYDKADNAIVGSQIYTAPQYNGNIEGMVWKSKGDGEKRKYDFVYDAANRLMGADFNQYTGSSFNKTAGVDFSMKMGDGTLLPDGSLDPTTAYDANGNILRMQQMGLKINSSSLIDNMRYTYSPNSNKLKSVTDFNNDALSMLGDFKTGSTHPQATTKATLTPTSTQTQFDAITDYDYDVNGNLNQDNNKTINSITYNYLNLPQSIMIPGKGVINYVYDATGNKLQKETLSTAILGSAHSTITTYINGFVYETKVNVDGGVAPPETNYTDVLQFAPQEEGRIRFKPEAGTTTASFAYDYFLKDHLGNVRMVLTEDPQQDKYPIASLEDATLATEKNYYAIQDAQIVDQSAATGITDYINDNGAGDNPSDPTFEAANSAKLYKLNSSTAKTGLGITLKVMAGDRIDVFGKSYYFTNNPGSGSTSTLPINDLLTGFLGGATGAAATAGHGAVTATQITPATGTGSVYSMFGEQNTQSLANPLVPRAFINVIFFDEQFKAVGYKVSMVGSNSTIKDHYADLQDIEVPKSGFVYIYCSNETPVDVFFDNLQVVHTRSPILEETHYYPFGLAMSGISSKSAGTMTNKRKYNSKEFQSQEFNDGSGLELYDYGARNQDPQIGRWLQVDPLAAIYFRWSPYNYCMTNPIKFIDPDGRSSEKIESQAISSLDLDQNGKVVKINRDGDPGVYVNSNNGRTLVGYMNPDVTYKIGGNYQYYGKKDYYDKHPMIYFCGIKGDNLEHPDPNPDQNNDYEIKREAITSVFFAILLDGLGESGEVENAAVNANNGRVFWSGGNIAKNAAMDFAKANGMKTIEMTLVGRFMNSVTAYLPRWLSRPIWNKLSTAFAKGASGTINVFQNSMGVNLESTWRLIEYKILKDKEIIYHIVNGIK